MKRLLALTLLLTPAWSAAQEEAYEAQPGLIRVGGLLLFYDTHGPLSFETPTPKSLPPGAELLGEVSGTGCQFGIAVPLSLSFRPTQLSGAFGKGGYEKALAAIRKARPGLSGLFDVKVDVREQSVLGLFRRTCVRITSLGFKLPG